MAERLAHRVVVRGRVQGVFFRDATRQQATRLGVAGWVRNEPDGTVAAHLEGPADAVGDLEAWIRAGGPPRADVDGVDVTTTEPRGRDGFEVR